MTISDVEIWCREYLWIIAITLLFGAFIIYWIDQYHIVQDAIASTRI